MTVTLNRFGYIIFIGIIHADLIVLIDYIYTFIVL